MHVISTFGVFAVSTLSLPASAVSLLRGAVHGTLDQILALGTLHTT